jgi:ribosomal protein L11 methyltransferase
VESGDSLPVRTGATGLGYGRGECVLADWLEVSVRVDDESVEPVSELFNRFARGGAVIEQVGGDGPEGFSSAATFVRGYLAPMPGQTEALLSIEAGLGHLSIIRDIPEPQVRAVHEEDWANAWKKHYKVLRIGEHIVIRPSWRRYVPRPGDAVVTLDPGMAFGTGLHPSTRLCLAALEERVRPGQKVLDLGAGSGILSVAAVKLGAGSVLALDNDPIAVEAATRNAASNGAERQVDVRLGSLQDVVGAFDLIVVNILAPVILQFVEDGLIDRLVVGGCIIAAGILDTQSDAVAGAFDAHGAPVVARACETDWVALTAIRRR